LKIVCSYTGKTLLQTISTRYLASSQISWHAR